MALTNKTWGNSFWGKGDLETVKHEHKGNLRRTGGVEWILCVICSSGVGRCLKQPNSLKNRESWSFSKKCSAPPPLQVQLTPVLCLSLSACILITGETKLSAALCLQFFSDAALHEVPVNKLTKMHRYITEEESSLLSQSTDYEIYIFLFP